MCVQKGAVLLLQWLLPCLIIRGDLTEPPEKPSFPLFALSPLIPAKHCLPNMIQGGLGKKLSHTSIQEKPITVWSGPPCTICHSLKALLTTKNYSVFHRDDHIMHQCRPRPKRCGDGTLGLYVFRLLLFIPPPPWVLPNFGLRNFLERTGKWGIRVYRSYRHSFRT